MSAISSNDILSDRAKSIAACLDAVQDRMIYIIYNMLNLSKGDGVVDCGQEVPGRVRTCM